MRKIKQIALVCIAAIGLFSCESEKIDGVVKDDTLLGEKILRFDLNGETRIAKGKDVSVILAADSTLTITATIKDKYSDFQPVVFSTKISHLAKGNFVTDFRNLDPLQPLYSSATFRYQNVNWEYATGNAPESVFDKGSLVIENLNVNSRQIEGRFSFDVYPPELEPVPGEPAPTMIKIENGYFKYLNY